MSEIRIVRDYPHAPEKVWRALTDPELIPRWTVTGAGAHAVGFAPVVGTRFQFRARPKPGWNGIVDCVVLEVQEPRLLRYSWIGGDGEGDTTEVVYRIDPREGGTRFTYEHTGFTGVGGALMARLLGRIRRRMLTTGLPAVLGSLESLDEEGRAH
ncbi:SRPBCC domain-containing protein [Streptomyces sp. NPDC001848]|uniref:SRPBCC family protein n=1 Tax=Streptomyces sp. NPDC001848 TaxID=3364618 RepID=UPI0036831F6B